MSPALLKIDFRQNLCHITRMVYLKKNRICKIIEQVRLRAYWTWENLYWMCLKQLEARVQKKYWKIFPSFQWSVPHFQYQNTTEILKAGKYTVRKALSLWRVPGRGSFNWLYLANEDMRSVYQKCCHGSPKASFVFKKGGLLNGIAKVSESALHQFDTKHIEEVERLLQRPVMGSSARDVVWHQRRLDRTDWVCAISTNLFGKDSNHSKKIWNGTGSR